VFGRTRSSFYKAEEKTSYENLEHALVIGRVREIRVEQPYIGTEKIYHLIKPFLQDHGIKMGRDKLDKLLRDYKLQSNRRKRRAGGTNSNHGYRKYPNLAKDKTPTRPNELWSSDITYIRTFNDFSYLSLITDSYSHKIVGWHLSENLSTNGPVKALEMALLNRRKDKAAKLPLMHHSDRGIQYCSRAYVALLKKRNVTISMSRASYQNPVAERINGILKTELLQDGYPSHEEALPAIDHAIDIYTNKRPHRSLDMMTPAEAHKKTGPIKKRWRTNSRRRKSAEKRRKSQQTDATKSVEP
jgi:transposase InsO family protein